MFRYRGKREWLVRHPLAGWGDGETYGAAMIPGPHGRALRVIFSSGEHDDDWEHVSVSTPKRCPNWVEMCVIKDLFWDGDDTVLQFHPPKSQYVNQHPFCLHLWRHPQRAVELPPMDYVGTSTVEATS